MKNLNWWLIKIDRICAWMLLIAVFLYIVSGYGMSKQVIDYENARWLHMNFLPFVILIAFTGHVSLALRTTFIRWKIWNRFTAILLFLVFAAYLLGFGYIEFYYQQTKILTTKTEQAQNNITTETIFTTQELSKYNGLNGMPAYAAVDGVVYDLSKVFRNGLHEGHSAGQDLTDQFYTVHMKQMLARYSVVGKLEN